MTNFRNTARFSSEMHLYQRDKNIVVEIGREVIGDLVNAGNKKKRIEE